MDDHLALADISVRPSLGPFGPVLGLGHRYGYLGAAIVMGSICLVSTIVTFILARTENDLKQRGRYLVFWNGMSATGVVTVYLMLNSFVGDFPCFVLLWTSYLCIVPWLLTYLARGWRLVYIYNQQVDFGKTTIPRSSTMDLNDLRLASTSRNTSAGAGTGSGLLAVIAGPGSIATAGTDAFVTADGLLGGATTSTTAVTGRDDLGAMGMMQQPASLGQGLNPTGQIYRGLAVIGSHSDVHLRQNKSKDEAVMVPAHHYLQVNNSTSNTNNSTTMITAKDLDAPLPPLPITTKSTVPSVLISEQGPSINNITKSTITPPPSTSSTPRIPSSDKLGDSNARTISSPSGIAIFPESNGVVLSNMISQEIYLAGGDSASHSCSGGRRTPRQPPSMTFEALPESGKHRWSRYLPFNQATDGRLTMFLMACMIFPFILCLGMQFVKPSPVQINPTSYKCSEGAVFYPIYAIMLGFLAIGCPILSWKLWWIKDGFGIRNELLINMCFGLPGFALYFISPFYLKKLDMGHWNHVNWLILTIFMAHVNSVVLPLIQFYLRQIPKQRSIIARGSSNRFASILRWDSPKTFPSTPTADVGSETSSFHLGHSRSSSQAFSVNLQQQQQHHQQQLQSSQSAELYESSISERQSIAHQSVLSQQSALKYHGYHGEEGISPVPINYSATTGQRLRGLKGFWAKYGKDPDGDIIPLSKMNPRAFEYALQDAEMLSEMVKFSVTVFSAENTKFLQEYDGLRKQVREYYRLAGHGNSSRGGGGVESMKKHSPRASDAAESLAGSTRDRYLNGSQTSSRSRRKKSSLLGSLASSLHSRRSPYGSGSMAGSNRTSRNGSRVGSIMEVNENVDDEHDGAPGASIGGAQTYIPTAGKSFGKHRQDLKGSLWRLSLQSSFRNSNPAFVSPPYGPLHEEEDADAYPLGRRTQSAPSPLSPRPMGERRGHHQHKASLDGRTCLSEMPISAADGVMNESKSESGGNDSEEGSSFSWYGRGNTGSSLSYHDVTPSEVSSFHDTASDAVQFHTDYFATGDVNSLVDDRQGDDLGAVAIYDPSGEGYDRSSHGGDGATPISVPFGKKSSQDISTSFMSTSAPSSKAGGPRSPLGPRHHASHSFGGISIGTSPTQSGQQKPLAIRKPPAGDRSPFHSPSSSVSATFTPRLPSQPQQQRPMPPTSFERSTSGRSVLTAEELRQLQTAAVSSLPSVSSATPTGQSSSSPCQPEHQQQSESMDSQSESQVQSSSATPTPPQSQERQQQQRSAFSAQTPSLSVSSPLSATHYSVEPASVSGSSPSSPIPGQDMMVASVSDSSPSSPNPDLGMMMMMPTSRVLSRTLPTSVLLNRPTPVPRALLPAYWEICHTFILPNAILELNLNEHLVNDIRDLFMTSSCFLEMYEPIVREVQELVYANVWPRFVQSIQRQPQGIPGKFKRSWRAFFSRGPTSGGSKSGDEVGDQEDHGIYTGSSSIGLKALGGGFAGSWLNRSRGEQVGRSGGSSNGIGGSTSQDQLQQYFNEGTERGYVQPTSRPLPPPQASYIHGQYGYLDGDGSALPGAYHHEKGGSEMTMMKEQQQQQEHLQHDLGHYGVMQDLDLSVLQRIVIDPK